MHFPALRIFIRQREICFFGPDIFMIIFLLLHYFYMNNYTHTCFIIDIFLKYHESKCSGGGNSLRALRTLRVPRALRTLRALRALRAPGAMRVKKIEEVFHNIEELLEVFPNILWSSIYVVGVFYM